MLVCIDALFILILFAFINKHLNHYEESFLSHIGIDPIVARMSGEYMRIACWLMPAMFLYLLLQKYLQVQVGLVLYRLVFCEWLVLVRALSSRSLSSEFLSMHPTLCSTRFLWWTLAGFVASVT